MKSIRTSLMIPLMVGIAVLSAAVMSLLYVSLRKALVSEFDQSLRAKANAIGSLVMLQPSGHLDFDYDVADENFAAFRREKRPEYFQIALGNGEIIQRSPSLNGGILIPSDTKPVMEGPHSVELPDGRRGRSVTASFIAKPDVDDPSAETLAALQRLTLPAVFVTVSCDSRGVDQMLSRLRGYFFLTTLLLVGAVGLLVPWVVRRGLKPLDAIGEHAAALGVESLRRAFPSAQTPRELAPITSRLNDLLARLAAAFDRESRFTASAAHELRTPIAEIRAVAEVALHWPEFDQSQRALADIVEVTGRTERLIEMLMKIGHARAGRIVTEAQPVNIGTLVEETMRSLLTTASERDLRITVKPQDTDRYAHVDPTLARAIVANLLANAVLHTPPRGNVTVDVACLDEAICLTIVNECSEISKEDIPKICEPFWTNSTSRSNRHHGLGLALVREYARILDAPLSFSLTEGGMFCATVTFAIDETSISSKAQSPMLREAALHPVRTGS